MVLFHSNCAGSHWHLSIVFFLQYQKLFLYSSRLWEPVLSSVVCNVALIWLLVSQAKVLTINSKSAAYYILFWPRTVHSYMKKPSDWLFKWANSLCLILHDILGFGKHEGTSFTLDYLNYSLNMCVCERDTHTHTHYHSKVWGQYFFQWNLCFLQQECNNLIKSDSKYIYNVKKISMSNKCCSFELSINQKCWNVSWFPQKYCFQHW